MTSRTIVGIGEILWDIFPDRKALGGAPTNFAYHCQQLGHEAYSVSAIGRDALGQEIEELLKTLPLNTLLQHNDYPTGTVSVTLNATGSPSYKINEQVAWDAIEFTPELEALAKRTDAVCFGSLAQRSPISRRTIGRFLAAMPIGSVKVFDVNLRLDYYTREIIENSLEQATILKLNDEEIITVGELLGVKGTMADIARQLTSHYKLEALILTRGAKGCHVFLPSGSVFYPSAHVEIADTVGAGDSFTAGFISALLAGKNTLESMALATRVAAHVCQHHGAMPQHPQHFKRYLEVELGTPA